MLKLKSNGLHLTQKRLMSGMFRFASNFGVRNVSFSSIYSRRGESAVCVLCFAAITQEVMECIYFLWWFLRCVNGILKCCKCLIHKTMNAFRGKISESLWSLHFQFYAGRIFKWFFWSFYEFLNNYEVYWRFS